MSVEETEDAVELQHRILDAMRDQVEKTTDDRIYFYVDLPEGRRCPKELQVCLVGFKPGFVLHHLEAVREYLEKIENIKAQPITDASSALIYWISDTLLGGQWWPITTKETTQKVIEHLEEEEMEKLKESITKMMVLEEEAEREAARKAKEAAKKAKEAAKKAEAREKSRRAFNPPEYPPAQKIKCKGSAQMISNAPAQRAWLEKWAKEAWNGKDLWSTKTAKQYVVDKKNGVETIFAVSVVIEALNVEYLCDDA
jgi:hypothetical protein